MFADNTAANLPLHPAGANPNMVIAVPNMLGTVPLNKYNS